MKKNKVLALLLTMTLSTAFVMPVSAAENVNVENVAVSEIDVVAEGELTWENYTYIVLEDNTVQITRYTGEESAITIPSEIDGKAVTSIRYCAFEYCMSLVTVEIPTSVTALGERSFYGCRSLEKITIPKSVVKIEEGSFGDCSKLRNIVMEANANYTLENGYLYETESGVLIGYCGEATDVVLTEDITRIGSYALSCRRDITSVKMTDNVLSIGTMAFESCTGITDIALSQNVREIESVAFFNCIGVTKLELPASVEAIGYRAFAYSGISEIVVDENNECFVVDDNVLYTKDKKQIVHCGDSRTEMIIPEGVEIIGPAAFDQCDKLTKVTFPGSLKIIDAFAFDTCEGLTLVTVPVNVEQINRRAFLRCYNMEKILIYNSNCEICDAADTFPEETVIYGFKDSTAQEYAEKYERTFVEIDPSEKLFLFSDVKETDWQYNGIKYVYERGIMEGFTSTEFGRDDTLTRSQFVTVLYSYAGKPKMNYTNRFPDVPEGEWYTYPILWAAEKGITAGNGNGLFDVTGTITREQLVTMLYAYAKMEGMVTEEVEGDLSQYVDAESVSEYAVNAFAWATQNGMISGKPLKDGSLRLDPQGTATRGECATIMMQYDLK